MLIFSFFFFTQKVMERRFLIGTMSKEEVIALIRDNLDILENTHPPRRSDAFYMNSYQKVAYRELMDLIRKQEDLPFQLSLTELIVSYRDKMNQYCCTHPNMEHKLIFSVAADVAQSILDEGGLLN